MEQCTNSEIKNVNIYLKFSVSGNLRFLSHAETIKLLQRACVRAGLEMKYTQGYNPRPQMSLPMARSVGVESLEEMAIIAADSAMITDENGTLKKQEMLKKINSELAEGIQVFDAAVITEKMSFCRAENEYLFRLKDNYYLKNKQILKHKIEEVLLKESIIVERRTDDKGRTHNIEVRRFIKSICMEEGNISACFFHSPDGSIRIDEFMQIIGLDVEKLKQPIKRIKTKWISW